MAMVIKDSTGKVDVIIIHIDQYNNVAYQARLTNSGMDYEPMRLAQLSKDKNGADYITVTTKPSSAHTFRDRIYINKENLRWL